MVRYRIMKALKKFPGPKPHFLFGNIHQIESSKQFLDTYHRFSLEFPRKFVIWYGPLRPTLSVIHPETIRPVIKAKTIKESMGYHFLLPWLGRGLLLENGKKWLRNRKLITPAFHFDILQSYTTIMNDCTSIFIDKLNAYATNDEKINLFDCISLLSFDILLRCAFSMDLDCQRSDHNHPFIRITRENTQLVEDRLYDKLRMMDFIYKLSKVGRQFASNCHYSHQIAQQLIQDRKKQLEESPINSSTKKLSFLDILLSVRDNMGNPLTIKEMRDEVENFLFAGHDTTTSAISWTLYCLAKYPQHQHKIYLEVQDLCKQGNLSMADLSKLQYTTMCIKEAIRLHTTVPMVNRKLEEDIQIDGILAPAGTEIEISPYALHHNPEIWPNPWEYDPNRFNTDQIQHRDPYAYIPFLIGSRNCIGQVFALNEIKIVVAKTIYSYNLQIREDYQPKHLISVVLKAVNGLWLTVRQR